MVNDLSSYIALVSAQLELPIPLKYRDGVRQNLERAAVIAQPLLELVLDDSVEAAPVFEPWPVSKP